MEEKVFYNFNDVNNAILLLKSKIPTDIRYQDYSYWINYVNWIPPFTKKTSKNYRQIFADMIYVLKIAIISDYAGVYGVYWFVNKALVENPLSGQFVCGTDYRITWAYALANYTVDGVDPESLLVQKRFNKFAYSRVFRFIVRALNACEWRAVACMYHTKMMWDLKERNAYTTGWWGDNGSKKYYSTGADDGYGTFLTSSTTSGTLLDVWNNNAVSGHAELNPTKKGTYWDSYSYNIQSPSGNLWPIMNEMANSLIGTSYAYRYHAEKATVRSAWIRGYMNWNDAALTFDTISSLAIPFPLIGNQIRLMNYENKRHTTYLSGKQTSTSSYGTFIGSSMLSGSTFYEYQIPSSVYWDHINGDLILQEIDGPRNGEYDYASITQYWNVVPPSSSPSAGNYYYFEKLEDPV